MHHASITLEAPTQNLQKQLGTYLLLEMTSREQTLQGLATATGMCPEVLARLLHGEGIMGLQEAWKLGNHWQISPEVLWNWQQDVAALDKPVPSDLPS